MRFRARGLAMPLAASMGIGLAAAPAGSAAAADYVFKSTNAISTANGFPHVTDVS